MNPFSVYRQFLQESALLESQFDIIEDLALRKWNC